MSAGNWYDVLIGDCVASMRTLPEKSVHTCITSPPYFGLRDYGMPGQIGLERTPEAYIARLVEVFREVRRVLRDDGTLWLNLGDSYSGSGKGVWNAPEERKAAVKETYRPSINPVKAFTGLKPKDLIGIPWRVAFALQADGWYLRQDIIWHKPNPMPESVTDRCTKAHEYIFLLSKSANYYFDAEAIKEPAIRGAAGSVFHSGKTGDHQMGRSSSAPREEYGARNKRSVWTVTTKPYKGAHFATFPPDLIEPCVLSGAPERCCAVCGAPHKRIMAKGAPNLAHQRACGDAEGRYTRKSRKDYASSGAQDASATKARILAGMVKRETVGWSPTCSCNAGVVGGVVLDPFGGSGTTAGVALKHGRNAILCELNPDYDAMIDARVDSIRFSNKR
jgi:site-specific DNA-methyltransferase (adenine-specific)